MWSVAEYKYYPSLLLLLTHVTPHTATMQILLLTSVIIAVAAAASFNVKDDIEIKDCGE